MAEKEPPPRFPESYGRWLSTQAQRVAFDWHDLETETGLSYQTVYRVMTGQPDRSVKAAEKIRRVLIARGLDIPIVPTGETDWKPEPRVAVASMGRGSFLGMADEPMRRNLVRFREDAGLDLHEASRATGIPLETLRAYELGDTLVSGPHLLELARVYQRPADHFDMTEPPPRTTKIAPHARITLVGQTDDMLPENVARLRELQRLAEEINAAEQRRIDDQRATSKTRRKPKKS